jgi:hypothetical protein
MSAVANDKGHRSHKLNMVETKVEIIRYAKGGISFTLSWTLTGLKPVNCMFSCGGKERSKRTSVKCWKMCH